MDFELSEQQAAFRDLMRDFARKSISPVAREWELAGRYPEEIVEEMKAMGLFGMLVPEEYGGIAIDAVSYSASSSKRYRRRGWASPGSWARTRWPR